MYEQSDLALIGSRIKAVRTGKGMSQADSRHLCHCR